MIATRAWIDAAIRRATIAIDCVVVVAGFTAFKYAIPADRTVRARTSIVTSDRAVVQIAIIAGFAALADAIAANIVHPSAVTAASIATISISVVTQFRVA